MPKKNIFDYIDLLEEQDYDDDDYIDSVIDAIDELKEIVTKDTINEFNHLLNGEDFWIREMVADLLAYVEGPKSLDRLLELLDRGFKEGHDNDGLQTITVNLIEAYPEESRKILKSLLAHNNEDIRKLAAWGLEFAKKNGDA